MTPIEELKKIVDQLSTRFLNIEKLNLTNHRHTGLDSQKIKFNDLDTVVYSEATINPSSLSDGVGETQSVTVKGANLGDFVLISAPYDLQDVTVTAYVQATDVVEIRIQNESGGVVNLASGTWRIIIIKKFV